MRETLQGHPFPPDDEQPWLQELEEGFPYEETPDQVRAIAEVKADMERARPMDRLVCGDVGYGKTEVALRAAFKAVLDQRQVAVLVPTTVLALQHFNTFSERLSPYPVRVELLSRFRSEKEQKEVLRRPGRGQVDIVIGTHRLLQKDVAFKNLGLLDHRRGAALRRGAQGAAQAAARRGGRADADGDADPAHALHGARRTCAT